MRLLSCSRRDGARRPLLTFCLSTAAPPLPPDFASGSEIKISVCSWRDLIALTPNDIISKLVTSLIAISSLFGIMHIGAFLASFRDRFDRSVVLRKLLDPNECSFEQVGKDGAWTWLLTQDGAPDGVDVFQLTGCDCDLRADDSHHQPAVGPGADDYVSCLLLRCVSSPPACAP